MAVPGAAGGKGLFTQEQQGCSARSQGGRLCGGNSLPMKGWVSASQPVPRGGTPAGQLRRQPPNRWSGGDASAGGAGWMGVCLLPRSLRLSGGCWGWSLPWWGSPGLRWSPDTSWEAVASCWPRRGVSGTSYPSSERVFPPPMQTRSSCCRCTALFALPGALLAPHLQISKGFLSSLVNPHVAFGICI